MKLKKRNWSTEQWTTAFRRYLDDDRAEVVTKGDMLGILRVKKHSDVVDNCLAEIGAVGEKYLPLIQVAEYFSQHQV